MRTSAIVLEGWSAIKFCVRAGGFADDHNGDCRISAGDGRVRIVLRPPAIAEPPHHSEQFPVYGARIPSDWTTLAGHVPWPSRTVARYFSADWLGVLARIQINGDREGPKQVHRCPLSYRREEDSVDVDGPWPPSAKAASTRSICSPDPVHAFVSLPHNCPPPCCPVAGRGTFCPGNSGVFALAQTADHDRGRYTTSAC